MLPPFVPPTQTRSPMIKLSVSSVRITEASVACRLTFVGCGCALGACMPELLLMRPVLGLFKLPILYMCTIHNVWDKVILHTPHMAPGPFTSFLLKLNSLKLVLPLHF